MRYNTIKSVIDRVVATLLLLILFPVIGLLLLLLGLATKQHPLFVQTRIGYRGQAFELYKIKTMYSSEVMNRLPHLGKVCLFLRKYSVDEIPQLWNVLKGDMSLIGPRPLLVEYLPLYDKEQRKRHQVKPGITGWAQIHGRNWVAWPQRFELDVWYVNNCSLLLDAKIAASTLTHLLRPTGVRPEGLSDAEKFRGNSISR